MMLTLQYVANVHLPDLLVLYMLVSLDNASDYTDIKEDSCQERTGLHIHRDVCGTQIKRPVDTRTPVLALIPDASCQCYIRSHCL